MLLVLLLIILSATALGLVKPNQARAISVEGIVDIAKTAFGMLSSVAAAPDQIKTILQGVGLAHKDTSSQPQASQSDTSKQLQDRKEKLNTISARLDTLNEEDRKDAQAQLAQTYKEELSNQPAPVRYSMQQNIQHIAPPHLQYLSQVPSGGSQYFDKGGMDMPSKIRSYENQRNRIPSTFPYGHVNPSDLRDPSDSHGCNLLRC